jgi:hypothetical protein
MANGKVTTEALVSLDLNNAGSAEVLPIAEIKVDEAYQRDLRYDLVNRIGANYDIVKAGPILVNERTDGTLWCVDGQHRMAGAEQAGETEIFAHVVHGLTKEEEAELRLARNDRRSDSAFEKFRTRLVMGEEKAHAIVEVARQHGTRINLTPDLHHGINSIAGAETLYDAGLGGGVWLGRVLAFADETWREEGDDQPLGGRAVGVNMMKALAWFFDRHGVGQGGLSRTELMNRLRQAGVDEIDRQARNHKAINGGSMWLNYYRALVGIWNKGRQEQNKIEAKTLGSVANLGYDQAVGTSRRPPEGRHTASR